MRGRVVFSANSLIWPGTGQAARVAFRSAVCLYFGIWSVRARWHWSAAIARLECTRARETACGEYSGNEVEGEWRGSAVCVCQKHALTARNSPRRGPGRKSNAAGDPSRPASCLHADWPAIVSALRQLVGSRRTIRVRRHPSLWRVCCAAGGRACVCALCQPGSCGILALERDIRAARKQEDGDDECTAEASKRKKSSGGKVRKSK